GADSEFLGRYTKGDIVVAGKNFGCGSSREHAAITLKTIGVGAVISESFGRIFYRNSINLGLPLVVCKGISEFVEDGDQIEVDLEKGTIKNITKNESKKGEKLPEFVLEMMEAGGIKKYYINKIKESKSRH
ncbi:MAG: 3-isopropylmalate dehydratase small subunit, partial [Bacillota bacterium]|nr:3-isopropylmalate dehydratase small subunit [Bacillota bacterium]